MVIHGLTGPEPESFAQFWPYYVSQHLHPLTRHFHAWGTLAGFAIAIWAVTTGQYALIAAAPVAGYGASWFSHFFIERNKPASFGHPAWSFRGDMRLLARYLRGTLGRDVAAVREALALPPEQLTLAGRRSTEAVA